VIVTVSDDCGHGALVIVHAYTYTPCTVTEYAVLPRLAFVNVVVPGPLTCVHVPIPEAGIFPARVDDNPQIVSSAPASAAEGAFTNVMFTVDAEAAQGALVIVQVKVYVPATVTVTSEVPRLALVKVEVPGPAV
jgi:hypothetical protein